MANEDVYSPDHKLVGGKLMQAWSGKDLTCCACGSMNVDALMSLEQKGGIAAIRFLYESAKQIGHEDGVEAGTAAWRASLRTKLDVMPKASISYPGSEAYEMGYGDAWREIDAWLGGGS